MSLRRHSGCTRHLLVFLEEKGEPVKVCGLQSVPRHREFWALWLLWQAGHAVHLLVVDLEELNSNHWLFRNQGLRMTGPPGHRA